MEVKANAKAKGEVKANAKAEVKAKAKGEVKAKAEGEAKAKAKVAQKSSKNKCVWVPQKKTCIQFPFAILPTRLLSFRLAVLAS